MKFKVPPKARKHKKRVGRGSGSGHGKTSGKGHKGQKARAGKTVRPGFEGGQTPIYRRLPKYGFTNIFSKEVQAINLTKLSLLDKDAKDITPEILFQKGIIKKAGVPVKILGQGELTKAMNIKAHAFSDTAKQKIEKAGGKVELVVTGQQLAK
jgi:large subunit ribosomal protein L15